jgi:hypothetical protein
MGCKEVDVEAGLALAGLTMRYYPAFSLGCNLVRDIVSTSL